jgi:type IV secretion system protein VirD4
MDATKVLWSQACTVVVAFLWTATEWTAWQLAFQPLLGQRCFSLFG